jgi:Uma2 family endonuclease
MGESLPFYSERYTVEEWENWNDPWELIDGFPYCMSPAPAFRHQSINTDILVEIFNQLKTCEKCKAVMPIDWQIDEQTVVQPDILVLCKPVNGKRLFEVPICLFEILSPSTKKKDRTVKFELYQRQGVKYYVMVDPETNSQEAFQIGSDGKYEAIPTEHSLNFDFEGCQVQLDMKEIWLRQAL